jgi:pimeloyl-ACP methyl ester carboxylesterase
MKGKGFILIAAILTMISCKKAGGPETTMKKNNFTNGYASVNGLKMYYEVHGKGGIPLVLIHGGGSTIETSFGNILPYLASYGQVIALELQAHGRTNDRPGEESFEQDADDIAGLLEFLRIERANLFGFSNGGNSAMQVAIRNPEKVNKLVIVSAFYKREGFIPGFFDGMEKASLENMPAPLKEAYLKVAPDTSQLRVMFDKDRNRMMNIADWTDESLKSIRAHTLLIVGDRDVVTADHTIKMSHLIPHARLMILPGTHGSFIGEVCSVKSGSMIPQLTAQAVQEFLKEFLLTGLGYHIGLVYFFIFL